MACTHVSPVLARLAIASLCLAALLLAACEPAAAASGTEIAKITAALSRTNFRGSEHRRSEGEAEVTFTVFENYIEVFAKFEVKNVKSGGKAPTIGIYAGTNCSKALAEGDKLTSLDYTLKKAKSPLQRLGNRYSYSYSKTKRFFNTFRGFEDAGLSFWETTANTYRLVVVGENGKQLLCGPIKHVTKLPSN